jgi:hypothetical protein
VAGLLARRCITHHCVDTPSLFFHCHIFFSLSSTFIPVNNLFQSSSPPLPFFFVVLFCHAMASSKKKPSPLTAFAPLHALAQLVPISSPDEISASGSKPVSKNKHKREREGAYILLTDLEPDTWRVYISHADGRWWSGAWHVADVEKLAVRTSASFPHCSRC